MVASAALLVCGTAFTTVLITVEEALVLAFPGATTARETLFLTDEQLEASSRSGGVEVSSALITRFVATGANGTVLGYAYLDTHRVRTLPETLMVVVDVEARVLRVEVVTFREPMEYIPREGWYDQYVGKELGEDLALKRGIRSITGATLTARATTDSVRRVLAVHRAVAEEVAP